MNLAVVQAASPPEWSAADWAQRLIDGDPVPADLTPGQTLAVAWALKDACYAAWSSQPQRAVVTADALGRLAQSGLSASVHLSAVSTELMALAHWTSGIAQVTQGQVDRAAASLANAADLFREIGQDDRAAQAQVPRIMVLTMSGQHALAAACAESTQREFLKIGDTHSAAKVTLNLGGLQLARDDYRSAVQHYRQAAVLFARAGDVQHSVMADIGLGRSLSEMGEMAEALRLFSRARMRAETHNLPVLAAVAELSVAVLNLARGHFRDALQGFERSRRRYEELAMPQQLAVAETQLGETYVELRLLPEALVQFERSLQTLRSLGMQDDQAWVLLSQARALSLQGRTDAAVASLQHAAVIFVAQDNRVGQGAATLAQAELAMHAGQPRRALELAMSASQVLHEQGQADRQVMAEVTAARALLILGEPGVAHERLTLALARAQELRLVPPQVMCLTGLGLAAQAMYQHDDAQHQFQRAITLFDEQRRALPCDDMRSTFLADHLRPYQEMLRWSLNLGASHAPQALARLDRLRARALGERLLQGSPIGGNDATRELRVRLNWLYRRVYGRAEGVADVSPGLISELRRTEQELLDRMRRERLLQSEQPASESAEEFDPAALCAALDGGDVLVEFGVLDDELFACVATSKGVQTFRRLASWQHVEAAIGAVRFQIDALRYGAAAMAPHMERLQHRVEEHLRRIYECVWAPLEAALTGCLRLVIVPHAAMGALPFVALTDGKTCLGERHALSLAPSAQIATRLMGRSTPAPKTVLAVGDSKHLIHASREAQAVADLFENGEALIDEFATIDGLRLRCPGADVIHLACHAEFRRDNPMFSALHLNDGPLTAEFIEGLRLPNTIVVLSACETGLVGSYSGDELIGLVRGFMLAGASRVLASLWPVDDAVTVELMRHFYLALLAGQSPSQSLQQAQREVRNKHPHPFYWAPFVIQGGW